MSGNNANNVTITPAIVNAIEKAIKLIGNQSHLAKYLGVSKVSVGRWIGTENKVTALDCSIWLKLRAYLEQNHITKAGDVQYMTPEELHNNPNVLTLSSLPADERQLLELFRLLTDDGKQAALATIKALANTFNKDAQQSAQSSTA